MTRECPIIEGIYIVERVRCGNVSPGLVVKKRLLGAGGIGANEFPIRIEIECKPLVGMELAAPSG